MAEFSNTGDNLSLLAPGDYDYGCHGRACRRPGRRKTGTAPARRMFDGEGGAHYAYVGGTSFSAPEVAGVAALIWAVRPDLRNWEVAEIIKQSAHRDTPGWNRTAATACSTPRPRSSRRPAAPAPTRSS